MRRNSLLTAAFWVLAGICFLKTADLLADTTIRNEGGEYLYFYYEAPNEQQVKYKFTYSSAETKEGVSLFKGVKIEQFAVTGGKPEMVAETPECVHDRKRSVISSAAPLQIHAQDGKYFVEGVGFFLQITNSSLVISNEVHSIFHTQPETNLPAAEATEIFSHRAEYLPKGETTNGLVIYQGGVRVLDPKINLTCEYLVAELPKDQTNRVNHIVALTNDVIHFVGTNGEQIQALGQQAVYDRVVESTAGTVVTNDILKLTGDSRINLTNGWMTADGFVMNRATGKLHGSGHFHFHHPVENPAANRSAEQSNPATTETIISSDEFEFDLNTRFAQFWGRVHVEDPRMQMSSESLAANLPQSGTGQTGHPDHILAETNVAIDFRDEKSGQKVHATGQKAVYDYRAANAVTNEVLELTGNPAVETAGTNRAGWMTADVITVDRAQGRIWGVGNHHSVIKKQLGEPATMDTEIFSDRFDFSLASGLSVYEGGVRAYDPEMNLTAKKLTLTLAKTATGALTNHLERADAVGDVIIDFIQKPFATGDLTNLAAFAARLKQPATNDFAASFVASQLSAPTRQLLASYWPTSIVPTPQPGEGARMIGQDAQLKQALVLDLNRLAESGALYESGKFTNVFLSVETMTLLRQQPLGSDLIQLNRLLLLDAFRGQLARGRTGEKILATGDRAIYSDTVTATATNVVLELSGHPKLEKPTEVITADDTIIYNRTTGITHFVGQPHLHAKIEGLATMPAPGGKTKK